FNNLGGGPATDNLIGDIHDPGGFNKDIADFLSGNRIQRPTSRGCVGPMSWWSLPLIKRMSFERGRLTSHSQGLIESSFDPLWTGVAGARVAKLTLDQNLNHQSLVDMDMVAVGFFVADRSGCCFFVHMAQAHPVRGAFKVVQ